MAFRDHSRASIGLLAAGLLSACSHQPAAQPPPSAAAPTHELSGSYTFVTDGSQMTINGERRAGGAQSKSTWQITPCGPGCSHVVSSLGWNADLHLVDNKWQAKREVPLDCTGNGVSSSMTYTLDSTTLTGTASNDIPCSHPPSVAVLPATLTKN
jgi:hypothetical protein